MISHINALRLETIGFKNPEFEFGQKWYSRGTGEAFVFVRFGRKKQPVFIDKNFNTREVDTVAELVYAPSLPEILTSFQGNFSMQDLWVSVYQGDKTAEIEDKVSQYIVSIFCLYNR